MPRSTKPNRDPDPKKLPQGSATWHVAVRRLDFETPGEHGQAITPHVVAVADLALDTLLLLEPQPSAPDAQVVWELLRQTMASRGEDGRRRPERPAQIEFEQAELQQALAARLADLQIDSRTAAPLAEVDEVVDGLNQAFGARGSEIPALHTVEGMTPGSTARFFEAAAFFYKQAPWKWISTEQPLKLRFHDQDVEAFVQVMGQDNQQHGLALYWRWEDLLGMYQPAVEPSENIPESGLLSVTYVPRDELPDADQAALRRYGWKTASRNACPLPLVYRRDGSASRPSRQELLYFEGLLRGLPGLIEAQHKRNGSEDLPPFELRQPVTTAGGPLEITFSYPAGEFPEDFWLDIDEDDDEPAYTIELPAKGRQAAELAEQAWKAPEPEQRIELARQAIKTWADHPLAYLVLADEAQSTGEEIEWLEKAVQAGERLFDDELLDQLEEDLSELWEVREGRYYLEARRELANALLESSQEQQALEQLEELLQLDMDDHTGARFQLINILLRRKDDQRLGEILLDFAGELQDAEPYLHGLLKFRQAGDSLEARRMLADGVQNNRLMAEYLTGLRPFPNLMPDAPGYDEQDQAAYFAQLYFGAWYATPGAVAWLKKQL
ncbi:MAG: DUF6930 domain-containing protein [Chloroflexota bacterium]